MVEIGDRDGKIQREHELDQQTQLMIDKDLRERVPIRKKLNARETTLAFGDNR